jgi:ribosomal protein L16 Arg81 hydroxylase
MMKQFSLEQLLSPIDSESFFQDYWETQPLIIPRNETGYYQQLFSVEAIDSVLLCSRFQPSDIRVVANQQEMLPAKYFKEEGSLNLNQLYKAYHEGHTLVVNGLQRFWQPLAIFCQGLQDFLNHAIVANLYFSPPQSQGLKPHYDTHDVFVLQIDGSKHWEIYPPTQPIPFLNSFQPVIPDTQLGEPLERICLQPGDLLYMPRGYIHQAVTTDSFSLHLTVSVYPTQWFDLIVNALTSLTLRDVRFRRALPIGFLDRPDLTPELQVYLQDLLDTLANKAKVEEAMGLLSDRLIRQTIPVADGQFSQLNQLGHIQLDTRVKKRSGMRCQVLDHLFSLSLQFPGNTIKFPCSHLSALLFIDQAQQPFTAQDLPELEAEQQLKLVTRLVQSGLLQTIQPTS